MKAFITSAVDAIHPDQRMDVYRENGIYQIVITRNGKERGSIEIDSRIMRHVADKLVKDFEYHDGVAAGTITVHKDR